MYFDLKHATTAFAPTMTASAFDYNGSVGLFEQAGMLSAYNVLRRDALPVWDEHLAPVVKSSMEANAHGFPETTKYAELPPRRPRERSPNNVQDLYKTELCNSFTENGSCPYGINCQFAHGYGDLRTVSRHPKYKTKMCRNFIETGNCPYGSRCRFIHGDEDGVRSDSELTTTVRPQSAPADRMSVYLSMGSDGMAPTPRSASPTAVSTDFETVLSTLYPSPAVPEAVRPPTASSCGSKRLPIFELLAGEKVDAEAKGAMNNEAGHDGSVGQITTP